MKKKMPPAPPAKEEEKDVVVPCAESGTVAPLPGPAAAEQVQEAAEALDPYGDLIPFADPNWYQSVSCVVVVKETVVLGATG